MKKLQKVDAVRLYKNGFPVFVEDAGGRNVTSVIDFLKYDRYFTPDLVYSLAVYEDILVD